VGLGLGVVSKGHYESDPALNRTNTNADTNESDPAPNLTPTLDHAASHTQSQVRGAPAAAVCVRRPLRRAA